MIIWNGKGILILVFLFMAGFIVHGFLAVFNLPFIDEYVFTLSLLIAALINYFFVDWLEKRPRKVLIDKETNEEVIMKDSSSLFFIPLKYWTYILTGGAVIILLDRRNTYE